MARRVRDDMDRDRLQLIATVFEALQAQAAEQIPTSWLDSLLTGPEAVITAHPTGPDIERLFRAIQGRIRALTPADLRLGEEKG